MTDSIWSADAPSEEGRYYANDSGFVQAVPVWFTTNGRLYWGGNRTQTDGILWLRIPDPAELAALRECEDALRAQYILHGDLSAKIALARLDALRGGEE